MHIRDSKRYLFTSSANDGATFLGKWLLSSTFQIIRKVLRGLHVGENQNTMELSRSIRAESNWVCAGRKWLQSKREWSREIHIVHRGLFKPLKFQSSLKKVSLTLNDHSSLVLFSNGIDCVVF